MKHFYCAECEYAKIRPLYHADIEQLRTWRNTPALSKFLSPLGTVTPAMQEAWFQEELEDANSLIFAIEETQALHCMVGSVSLYDLRENRAKIGKIVIGNPAAHGRRLGYYGMILAAAVAFQELGVLVLCLDVHSENEPAKAIYRKMGFRIVGTHPFTKGGHELEMELTKKDFYTACSLQVLLGLEKEGERE